ncbi:uncharacterized protein METZ01_LOCUS421425, partial [marine metagenome]
NTAFKLVGENAEAGWKIQYGTATRIIFSNLIIIPYLLSSQTLPDWVSFCSKFSATVFLTYK